MVRYICVAWIIIGMINFLFVQGNAKNILELPVIPKPQEANFSNLNITLNICTLRHTIIANPAIKNEVIKLFDFYYNLTFNKKVICEKNNLKNQLKDATDFNIEIDLSSKILIPDDFNTTYENYTLDIQANYILLKSLSYAGFVRGIETFSQLINPNTNDPKTYVIENGPIYIKDYPSYKVRGLMIDASRHFVPLEYFIPILNGMMYTKLNILHLHLSDDESYTLSSIKYPNLTNYTTYEGNSSYSVNQMRELIHFAQTRAVHIIPEFDNPAHIRALGNYPDFQPSVTCYDSYPIVKNPAGLNITIYGGAPGGNLDPTMDLTYNFMNNLISDYFNIFNSSRYIHLGGDEVNYNCWDTRPSIKEYMKAHSIANYNDMFSIYLSNIRANITKQNASKVALYWALDPSLQIKYRETDILQFWGKSTWIADLLKQYPNNPAIISTYDFHYLDCGSGSCYGDGTTWCDPYKSWLMIYSFNLYKFVGNQSRVLGIIMPAWSEMINADALEQKLFPRGTALGEALWSNITEVNDLVSITTRIVKQTKRMRNWGVRSNAIGKQWCEEKPDICYAIYNKSKSILNEVSSPF